MYPESRCTQYCLSFVYERQQEDLIIVGSLFKIVGTATEKSYYPMLSFVFGTKCCLKTDDLGVLWISEECNILTKYVGCWVEWVLDLCNNSHSLLYTALIDL